MTFLAKPPGGGRRPRPLAAPLLRLVLAVVAGCGLAPAEAQRAAGVDAWNPAEAPASAALPAGGLEMHVQLQGAAGEVRTNSPAPISLRGGGTRSVD